MLEERLSYTYGRHGIGGGVSSPAPYQPPPAHNAYPTLPSGESYYGVGGDSSNALQSPYPPQQINYQSYYTQPHAFDKRASSLHNQPPDPKQTPSRTPQQYNGYNGPSQQSEPSVSNVHPQAPESSANIPSQQQPTGSLPPHQQSPPQPQSTLQQQVPDASYWQYPKNGQQNEFQYPYSPSSQPQPWQNSGPSNGSYGHPSYGFPHLSEASTPHPIPSPQQQPKVVEDLIDL